METVLPLVGAELVIRPAGTGYRFALRKSSSNVCDVMTIDSETRKIGGEELTTYFAGIHLDYDDHRLRQNHALLDPEFRPPVRQLPDGRLYCRVCHCIVPNTANNEMRKEGCYAHSHVCGIKANGEVYLTDEQAADIEKGD